MTYRDVRGVDVYHQPLIRTRTLSRQLLESFLLHIAFTRRWSEAYTLKRHYTLDVDLYVLTPSTVPDAANDLFSITTRNCGL
jgi:hypothetical protein